MKTIKIAVIIFCSILVHTSTLVAQEISGNDAQENLFKLGGIDVSSGIVRKFDNRYEGVKGTPYYSDNWSRGSIVFENGQSELHPQMKYSQFEDELIVKQSERDAYYVSKDLIRSFTMENEQGQSELFIKKNHPKKEEEMQYYRVITAGEMYLLELVKVVFEKADFGGGYSNEKRFDEFKKYPAYYYLHKDSSTPVKIKQTTGGVLKIFEGRQDEIKAFIADNKMDCRDLEELSRIFSYANSLP